jgi:hypothetical protein
MCICHIADKLTLDGGHAHLSCNSAAHKFRPLVWFAHNVVRCAAHQARVSCLENCILRQEFCQRAGIVPVEDVVE